MAEKKYFVSVCGGDELFSPSIIAVERLDETGKAWDYQSGEYVTSNFRFTYYSCDGVIMESKNIPDLWFLDMVMDGIIIPLDNTSQRLRDALDAAQKGD